VDVGQHQQDSSDVRSKLGCERTKIVGCSSGANDSTDDAALAILVGRRPKSPPASRKLALPIRRGFNQGTRQGSRKHCQKPKRPTREPSRKVPSETNLRSLSLPAHTAGKLGAAHMGNTGRTLMDHGRRPRRRAHLSLTRRHGADRCRFATAPDNCMQAVGLECNLQRRGDDELLVPSNDLPDTRCAALGGRLAHHHCAKRRADSGHDCLEAEHKKHRLQHGNVAIAHSRPPPGMRSTCFAGDRLQHHLRALTTGTTHTHLGPPQAAMPPSISAAPGMLSCAASNHFCC
jgi:hypothetical protein